MKKCWNSENLIKFEAETICTGSYNKTVYGISEENKNE